MRFTLATIPFWTLLFLPILVAYNGHGLVCTLLWLILWFAGRQALVIHGIFTEQEDKRLILNSQPNSNYVEKVRWCLEKSGTNYDEEKDVGIFGRVLLGRLVPVLNIPGKHISISNSSDILRYLYATTYAVDPERAKFLEPSPEAVKWEAKIDQMGDDIRAFVYYHALVASKNPDECALKGWAIDEDDVPPWQKTLLKVTLPVLKLYLGKVLNITKEGADEGLRKCEVLFKEVDEILKNGQKYILGGDEPTYLDYSFASLAAIYACPDNYGGSSLSPKTRLNFATEGSKMGSEFQKAVIKFRKTPSGKHILKMYSEHR